MSSDLLAELQTATRQAVAASGLSQEDLACRSGMDPSSLSRALRHGARPKLETLERIWRAAELCPDFALEQREPSPGRPGLAA